MKELSIQEKARAYDKVREKIAIRFGSNVADEIFSEYEESEDERIRKDIISFVEQAIDAGYGIISKERKEKWIAWLEKQGNLMKALQISNSRIAELVEEKYNLEEKLKKQGEQKPVSESLNTASMIESYKKRLISQANGMKNPLIDMCLVSYKHGINETLYTLNLSNVERTVKDWKEPVSEDLGEYVNELSKQFPEVSFAKLSRIAVRVAKWQKEYLWKPADGDDLPEIDKEVIVLIKYDAQVNIHEDEYPTYRVGFGHRPNPNGWDAVSIITEKKEHYIPKTYGKGGWNIPDVKYWLDCSMPKEIEL